MTIVDNLKSKIDSSGNLILETDFLKDDELNNFLKIFNIPELKVVVETDDSASITFDGDVVRIKGCIDFLNITQVFCTISLSNAVSDKYSFKITVIFSSMSLDTINKYAIALPQAGILSAVLPLDFKNTYFEYHSDDQNIYFGCLKSDFSLDYFKSLGIILDKIGFEVSRNLTRNSFSLIINASIELGETEIDIIVNLLFDLKMNLTGLKISLDNSIDLTKGLNDIISFLSDKFKEYFSEYDLSKVFPDNLISVDFNLSDFQLLIDPQQMKPSHIYFEVRSDSPYQVYGGLDLCNTGIGMEINIGDKTNILTSLFGGIKLDDTLSCNIELQVPYPLSNDWSLCLDGGINLKSISDLKKLPMVSSIDEFLLPQGIFDVNSLDVRLFKVAFNPSQTAIKSFDLDICLLADFDIVPGKITFKNPELILSRESNGSFTGSLSCISQINNVSFSVSAIKNIDGWEFQGRSIDGNIDLKSIVEFISPVDLKLPSQFELKLENMGWDIKSNLFNIYSDILFDFGFGSEKCQFNFTRSVDGNNKDYKLFMEYAISENTYFDLIMEDNTGFVLSGELKTKGIGGGTLDINYILGKIGKCFGDINFPKVSSIEIESAFIQFDKAKGSVILEGTFNNNLNLLLAMQKGSSWDFVLAIDYSKDIKLSDIMALPMPDFIDLKDIFLAYSTVSQDFTFKTKNKTSPTITLKQDNLSLGAVVSINGEAGDFTQDLIGNELDAFISGSINVKTLALDLIAQLESAGERTPFSGNSCYPALTFKNFKVEINVISDNITLSLACDLIVSINGKSVLLDGRISIEENQFEISATLKGDPIEIPLIPGYKFVFNDLAFELGDGYELEDPVMGYTGEVTFAELNVFEAILLDTAEPQNCMVATSMNKLPALDLMQLLAKLCADYDKSLSFLDVLNGISISGTKISSVPCTDVIVSELNNGGKCPEIANELKIHDYKITQGKDGSDVWFIRDENTAKIYQVMKENGQLNLSNELQFYIVPNTMVKIGDITFNQGLRLDGCINLFDFKIAAQIDISSTGIKAEANCDPLKLYVVQFTSTSDTGKGPVFSLDTRDNPHLYLDGKISLLGLSEDVHADISDTGVSFQLTTDLEVFTSAVTVTSNKWENLQLKSDAELKLSVTTPKIEVKEVTILPAEDVSVDVKGGVSIYIDSTSCNCTLNASVVLGGETIYSFSDDDKIKVDNLADFAACVEHWIMNNAKEVFGSIKNDIDKFSNLVKNGIINLGDDLAKALTQFPGFSAPGDVAKKLRELIPGMTDNDIVKNLSNALFTNQQISDGLFAVEPSAQAAANALKEVLKITDAKTLSNLLSASGFSHVDSAIDSLFSCSCFLKIGCVIDCFDCFHCHHCWDCWDL